MCFNLLNMGHECYDYIQSLREAFPIPKSKLAPLLVPYSAPCLFLLLWEHLNFLPIVYICLTRVRLHCSILWLAKPSMSGYLPSLYLQSETLTWISTHGYSAYWHFCRMFLVGDSDWPCSRSSSRFFSASLLPTLHVLHFSQYLLSTSYIPHPVLSALWVLTYFILITT